MFQFSNGVEVEFEVVCRQWFVSHRTLLCIK